MSEASATLESQLPESSHYPASSEPRESAQLVNVACGQCGQQHSQRDETGSERTHSHAFAVGRQQKQAVSYSGSVGV